MQRGSPTSNVTTNAATMSTSPLSPRCTLRRVQLLQAMSFSSIAGADSAFFHNIIATLPWPHHPPNHYHSYHPTTKALDHSSSVWALACQPQFDSWVMLMEPLPLSPHCRPTVAPLSTHCRPIVDPLSTHWRPNVETHQKVQQGMLARGQKIYLP